MVEEDDLGVLRALDFYSLRVIADFVDLWIDADDLSVSFVSEQQTLI